jgi:diketogulonate reductase-like aldo/keto reductase
LTEMSFQVSNTTIGVGFGTAALGGNTYNVVTMALEASFRKFDTAEADWWYDQPTVGRALKDFFSDKDISCDGLGLEVSTKIPPWSLTSVSDIRDHAAHSRTELLGFCEDTVIYNPAKDIEMEVLFPLDVYYIHAPKCWNGWHPRCDNAPPTLNLRDSWTAMEAVAGVDHSAKRIGLSNVHPNELMDIIRFAQERIERGETNPPPRIPDALQAYADPLKPAEELRAICEEYGIEFVSYSTLGTQHRSVGENPVLTSPIVKQLAEKHSRSVAEVVLSWAVQKNMSVIPRSNKKHHIQELARLLKDPTFLDESDLQAIDSMSHDDLSEL